MEISSPSLIDSTIMAQLLKALSAPDIISRQFALARKWKIVVYDDNVLSDEYAEQLSAAMLAKEIREFHVLPVNKVYAQRNGAKSHVSPVSKKSIEDAFNPEVSHFALMDCILFSLPLNFLVLRTGAPLHLICSGPNDFIEIACGISAGDESVIPVGTYWEANGIHTEYGFGNITDQ